MAKSSSIAKNERRKRIVAKYAAKRQELKKLVKSIHTSPEDRELASQKLSKLPRDANPIRVRNRCIVSGRSRGYMRRFGLSRIEFRMAASRGEIPGLTKASW